MPKSIYELVLAAYKAITVPDLGDARLLPEQADRFVRIIERSSPLLGEARRLDMRNDRRNIDRTGFSDRILGAPQAEGTQQTNQTDPDRFMNQLDAQKVRGSAVISFEALEENIERDNFNNTLVDMIGERSSVDLVELFLAGDTASADDFLALTDGWLVKAEHQLDGTAGANFDPDDVEDMFEAMILSVPEKYFRDRSQWRIKTTFSIENAYRDVLRARGTALGDAAQTSAQPVNYKGFRIDVEQVMPSGSGWLTEIVNNTVYGLRRDIEIEPERKPSFDRWDFHVRGKADAHYEDENAAVHAFGSNL